MATPRPGPSHGDGEDQDQLRLVTFLHGIVEQETARIVRGKVSWSAWLGHAARHGRYGFANTLLISAQRPTATQIRSYQEWKKLGRQVRRGESGVRILTRDGQPRAVFDVAQTAEPPAEPPPPVSSAHRWGLLTRLAADLGLWVERNERWVYTGPPDRIVHIGSALDDDAAVVLLAHQLAHLRLHYGLPDRPDDGVAACHGVRRVEADSAAFLLLVQVGTATPTVRFPPVTTWAGADPRANPSAAVRVVGDRVLDATAWLAKRLGPPAAAVPTEPAVRRPAVLVKEPERNVDREPEPGGIAHDELVSIQVEAHRAFLRWWEPSWVPGYLIERGFSPEIRQQWGIGYAPKAWRAMTDHLRQRGHSDAAIVASGLARRAKDGHLIDTFRDRAMLPLRRPDGTIAGFIGRGRGEAAQPKYLNSPASDLFRKGDLMFGLYEVRDQLAHGARPVLVEGPFDAIAVNTAAPETHAAFAPCGTSITARQLAALADATDLDSSGLLVALDGDQAGQAAMLRSWSVLAKVGGPLLAVLLPKAQDPADILRYQGCMAVREALAQSVPLTDLIIDQLIERGGPAPDDPEEALTAVRASAAALAHRPPTEFAGQVIRIAAHLNIAPAHVASALLEAISTTQPSPGRLARQGFPGPPTPLPAQAEPPDKATGSHPPSTPRRAK